MATTPAYDLMAAACPTLASLRSTLSADTSARQVERIGLTHALHCTTCQPIADQARRALAAHRAELEAQPEGSR